MLIDPRKGKALGPNHPPFPALTEGYSQPHRHLASSSAEILGVCVCVCGGEVDQKVTRVDRFGLLVTNFSGPFLYTPPPRSRSG